MFWGETKGEKNTLPLSESKTPSASGVSNFTIKDTAKGGNYRRGRNSGGRILNEKERGSGWESCSPTLHRSSPSAKYCCWRKEEVYNFSHFPWIHDFKAKMHHWVTASSPWHTQAAGSPSHACTRPSNLWHLL